MKRPRPTTTHDAASYWSGCQREELLLQRCAACGSIQFPHRVICASCGCRDLELVRASGDAVLCSYTIVYRPPAAVFNDEVPYVVALVDLAEGPRMMTNIVGIPFGELAIGMPLRVLFDEHDGFKVPVFGPTRTDEERTR